MIDWSSKRLCTPKRTFKEINKPKKKNKNKNSNNKVLVKKLFFRKEKNCYPSFASEVRTGSTDPVQEIINDKIKLIKSAHHCTNQEERTRQSNRSLKGI